MKSNRPLNHRNRILSRLRIVAAGALLSAASAMAFAAGSNLDSSSEDAAVFSTAFVPASATQSTVVVQLSGKSVAEAQADAGRKLASSEKNQIKNQLKGSQDALKPQIQAAGGTIRAQFQSALNGIKVNIATSKLNQLSKMPGVIALLPVHQDVPDNATSVPYIGAPTVWDAPTNYRGEGIKIGVIDTGIDYTHANFAGPGTVAAFNAANATDTAAADPSLFGPAAPKVKGGFDLVGDNYTGSNTPAPDSNPLDCNGHGSHVAGTATGLGVTSAGATYAGAYDPSAYTSTTFKIGPGVAPKADLYGYRVFGCTGSTDVTVDAINMAFDDGMDVINMSLGSSFGTANDASAVASTNVAKAGMIVVASAGNSGPNQYITGSPATGDGVISVAANDAKAGNPGATMAISTDGSINAQNSNGATFANGTVLPVAVLRTSYPSGPVALGCVASDYANYPGGVAGKLVVTLRGSCSRVARPIFGEQAGAAAVAMIDTSSGYPVFEGPITGSAETGPFNVTIPFFGVRGVLGPATTADGDNLITADSPQGLGGTVTLNNTFLPNPAFSSFASFTSGGPRTGDSGLKPDITAPGVSTVSALVGSGNGSLTISGTSMASPHVAGVAALVKQAHPDWKQVQEWKAAIVNTGNPSGVGGSAPYRTSRGGSGLVQPIPAVNTNVIALGDKGTSTLNFGFSELKADFSQSKEIKLRNKGASAATFNISQTNAAGSAHSIVPSSTSVLIPAGGETTVNVTLNVPVATAGNSASFREVAGLITLTPATASDNNGVTLRVPYYLVPRALSGVKATMAKTVTTASPTTNAIVSNASGPIAGEADFYAWGLNDAKEGTSSADVRAIGVQSFANGTAADPNRRLIVFAVNTWNRWSNAATNEFDINVDVDPQNNNGDDYIVAGVDRGAVETGSFSGQMAVFVFSTRSPGFSLNFLATAPSDSSTALLPVRSSQLCRTGEPCISTGTDKRFNYTAAGFDLLGSFSDEVAGSAKFNAGPTSAISQGMYAPLPVGASGAVPVTINPTEWALTPALGVMAVSLDNKSGQEEAALLPLTLKP